MDRPNPTGYCAHCGAAFPVTKATKRFCSTVCQRAYNAAKQLKPIPEARPCAWCGRTFTPKHSGIKCCSVACSRARNNAKAKANRHAGVLAQHRGVTPRPQHGNFCPDPHCSWLKWDGYGEGFCVRPVCIHKEVKKQ